MENNNINNLHIKYDAASMSYFNNFVKICYQTMACTWVCMQLNCLLRISMDLFVFTCFYLDIRGFIWIYIGLSGFQ